MRKLSKKMISIFLSVVLVMGIFSLILPTANFAPNVKAEAVATTYDYEEVLNSVGNDTTIADTRVWDVNGTDFGTNGLKSLGIWNAMGLDAAYGALGISHNFFGGTAVGAERDEIHPYIVYNVTPGTAFELSSAVHKDSNENESVLSFYVSNDGVTWIPVAAERNSAGVWNSKQETYKSYTSYVYTIDNVGLKTNFVKAEYPMTMASKDGGREPSAYLLVYGAKFTAVENYAVNGQTLFEAMAFARQKELYEEHFIAYPDFVNMDTSVSSGTSAATSNYGMLQNSTWGDFKEKDRSYIAMVAPGSRFYLETANNWFIPELGNALGSVEQARIRVYSSATLSDDAEWTEWAPMPYSCGGTHTPTFNFYLPKDHIYVRIVYPQKGRVGSVEGFSYTDVNGNDAAFFTDMVFTPYDAADADFIYDYTSAAYWEKPQAGTSNLSQDTGNSLGITIPWTNGKNLVNAAAQNTEDPYAKGHFSIQYAVEGGKMFNLEYAVRIATWTGNTKGCYEANVTDGSSMEFIIESSTDNVNWTNAYETESGYAETSVNDGDRKIFDVSYLVPKDAKYVRVSFGMTGVGYLNDNSTYQGFNDCIYLRKVSVANANNVYTAPVIPVEYVYTTDTDASKATSASNTETASIDGATGFRGGYGHLVAGDGANVKTLAGTLERPYVIYDVVPGSNFSFDYSMYATAKASSETTAALNIKAGLGSEALREFEFFVYGRADENSAWQYIGKTDSSALDYRGGNSASYGTNGYGKGSFDIPADVTQVKVELPNTGALTTATPVAYDYSTASGNYGMWNNGAIGADYITFNDADGEENDNIIGKDGNGIRPTYGSLSSAWGTKEFYIIYKVKPGTTFVANLEMHDSATREGYAAKTGEPFEAKLQYSADKASWSEAITTAGQGTSATLGCIVPAGNEYVKITFPQKGIIPDSGDYRGNDAATLTGVSFYPDAWITAGNDAAHLYNVKYASGTKPGPDVDYTALDSANITNASKAELNIYNQANTQLEKDAGIKAKADGAFVIYKIKENTMLTVNSGDALSFEYSTDDINYKPFEAVKTCRGYEIPAIKDRNYIKVKLDNGEAITNAYAEVLAPTVKFYIPYLDKYDLKDVAGYGAAANSVSPTINTLRPGYKFEGWTEYDDEGIYIDKTVKAVYIPDPDKKYTVSYTVGKETVEEVKLFDNRVTISADATNDKGEVFSKWVDAKGATVSNSRNFSFLVSGNIALKAVYAKTKEDIAPYIYVTDEPIITWNDDDEETWNLSVVWRTAMSGDVTVKETGILLGKDVDKAHLILWDGKTQENTFKMKHNNTATNKTAVYTVKNIKAGETRTALPYAILPNGDVIYGENVIKVTNGEKVTSTDFEFNGTISPTVLNNYLDRAVSYDAFGTADGQDSDSAIYNARDFVRKTGAKYLARGLGFWIPNGTDIYGDNFTKYKNWVAEIHEVDPEVIIEACIFETCSPETNDLVIPDWVQAKILGADNVQTGRKFNYDNMIHTWKGGLWGLGGYYGREEFNTDGIKVSIPSISREETQMFIYYRACTFIDMGVEAIHFGQMYRIGATATTTSGTVSEIDYANWTKVIDAIREYAAEHARRGYVLVNGHNENQKLLDSKDDEGKTMLVDFNAYPIRIKPASGVSNTTPANAFQAVKLDTSSNAPYNVVVTGMKTPSGYTVADCYPYLLEFDNFGVNTANLNKVYSSGDYVWGYDEISWYVNQQAQYRHTYLTTIVNEVAGLSAANGHVALPGKRTAFISATGASEYLRNEANIYNGKIYSTYYDGTYGAQIPLWDAKIAGDVEAIKAAFDSLN